ncbi:hypothetical protein F4804DRAFT_114771 [Jackrogersella minutella]|nr:hypothetical protein F4804DRAFT_114771 [Jackrogersella minutella]
MSFHTDQQKSTTAAGSTNILGPTPSATATSSDMPAQKSEFWIKDNQPKILTVGNQSFTIIVERNSDPVPGEYVRLKLLEWYPDLTPPQFAATYKNKLWGQRAEIWDKKRFIEIKLDIITFGHHRIEAQIKQERRDEIRDHIVMTLDTEDIKFIETGEPRPGMNAVIDDGPRAEINESFD